MHHAHGATAVWSTTYHRHLYEYAPHVSHALLRIPLRIPAISLPLSCHIRIVMFPMCAGRLIYHPRLKPPLSPTGSNPLHHQFS